MVKRRRLGMLGSFAIAFGILVVACGSGFLDGLSGGRRDAGAEDADIPDVKDDGRLCQPIHAPPRPVDVQDSEEPNPVVVAIESIRIDDATNVDASVPPTRGFDLDQRCTCPEEPTCTPPPDAGNVKSCDGDGGTDNALGRMFAYLGSIFADEFGPDFLTRQIRQGSYGALFSIGGWNHLPDDPKVVVSVFLSHGNIGKQDGGKDDPKFDGTEIWTIDPASVQGGEANIGADCDTDITACFPLNLSKDAYVSQGYLVAKMEIPLAVSTSSGRIVIEFEDVTLVAKLTKDGTKFRLDGEFVGRWPVDRVLESLSQLPVNDKPLCEQTAFFEVARQEVCNNVDVVADKAQDNTGARCNALSASIRFAASTAKLGPIFAPSQAPPPCTSFVAACPQ